MKKLFILLIMFTLAITPAFATDSTDAILQYNQGIDLYKIGQYDKAIDCFKSAISLDPNYIDAYFNLGSVLEYLGQYEAALAVFKQIIVRQPEDYDSIYKAAWLSVQMKQYARAKSYLSIIPPTCERAKDAQALRAQIKASTPSFQAKAPTPNTKVSQANNLYQNIASPTGITTDSQGNLYVAGFNNNVITKITPTDEKIIFVKDPKISGPIGLACDGGDNIYIANYNKNNVLKVSSLGEISNLISNVKKPYCLYISGNVLFVSCQGSNSVLKYKLDK